MNAPSLDLHVVYDLYRSYNWDYILYFGYCYWDGDCILCTKQVVDGGSGLLSDLVCRRRRLPPLLVVASCGGKGSWRVPRVFLEKQDVSMLCDKAALL